MAQRRGLLLAGVTLGVWLLTSVVVTAVIGPAGLFLGPLTVLIGVVFVIVPFGYGYWFSKPVDRA